MDGPKNAAYQEWAGEEWAGEPAKPEADPEAHWTKDEVAWDQRGEAPPIQASAAEMTEGETGLSGFRHTAPAAQWTPPD